MKMKVDKTIILIGPICSGKTSVAEIISKRLNIPHCSIDDVRFSYYEEMGYKKEIQEEIKKREGFTVSISIGSHLKPILFCKSWKTIETMSLILAGVIPCMKTKSYLKK